MNLRMNRLISSGDSFSGNERNCLYLNVGNPDQIRFANISAVSGFDFPDDGRGLASTDWDFDGDLDFWISNRNAPRIRFLRNDLPEGNRFLQVKLNGNGTTCNRDAIGARLELDVGDTTLLKTVIAGDSFLAQSSKWVHFGLGPVDGPGELRVRWPDGTLETFKALKPNSRYQITQGENVAAVWPPPQQSPVFEHREVERPSRSGAIRAVVKSNMPLPRLEYIDFEGRKRSLREHLRQPIVLNLWASWCTPCVVELSEFQQEAIPVLALTVDGINAESPTTHEDAKKLLESRGFEFPAGLASESIMIWLQAYHDLLFTDTQPLPVPTSFLIDTDGTVAAIYKGAVSSERIKADHTLLTNSPDKFRQQSLPFEGKWLAKPPDHKPADFAYFLILEDQLDMSLHYLSEFVPVGTRGFGITIDALEQKSHVSERKDLLERIRHLRSRSFPF